MTANVARAITRPDVCPYCGQPVTRTQLEEIRGRVRREEQVRLKELEEKLRAEAVKRVERERAENARRAQEISKREAALAKRAKDLEAAAKAKFDDGYRKARTEGLRTQQQLQKQVEDLRRRLERKTADDLGATSEEDLPDTLRRRYPGDSVEPVPRGTGGADIIHEVRDRGAACGRIIYESKNVKNFLSTYVDKARGYRTQYDTPYVILVTTAFPAGERDFCTRDGILLIHPSKVGYLVDVLRRSLVELAKAGLARAERDAKGERVLAYVTSSEFKERIRGIIEITDDLRNLQAEERKRHEHTWVIQEEAFRGLEQYAGRIDARVKAIVEGRERAVQAAERA